LADRLLELTNKTIEPKTYHISLSEHCRYLKRLLDDPNFSDVMIPNQSAMTVTLPSEHDSAGESRFYQSSYLRTVFIIANHT